MSYSRLALLGLSILFAPCALGSDKATLEQLNAVKPDLKDEKINGGLDKVMQGYQRFLELTPEAIHHLADIKFQQAYVAPEKNTAGKKKPAPQPDRKTGAASEEAGTEDESRGMVQPAGMMEAIALYKKLLDKFPAYQRRDQVLYQLSYAYEELGDVDESIKIINRLVKEYPNSRNIDELQFRRGEYYFTRKKFKEAESGYKAIVDIGSKSSFYEPALYKLGWTLYKQELYTDALQRFFALLDYKISTGYDAEHPKGTPDEKRIDDSYRAVSLCFSSMGGADAVMEYFDRNGKRKYEPTVYSNLAEHYLEKRRYDDAAKSYKDFVKRNPYDKMSPQFDMRVIETYKKGGFPKLVLESNKDYVSNYGLKSQYWKHFDVKAYPEVLVYVKTNLKELAHHYHALYQDERLAKDKEENFQEAMKWYRAFLDSYPQDAESPAINYQLAELLNENKRYDQAVAEYEHTAYQYAPHEKSTAAAYAAVAARRDGLATVSQEGRERAQREVIRSSLKFSETFPQHEKSALVMAAAVEDIYRMKEYDLAQSTARKLLANFPNSDQGIRRSAWLIIAHSSFDLAHYAEAEEGYLQVLQLTPERDASRNVLAENLAAAIYKQGEQANKLGDFKTAAGHFLRVGKLAPTSKIRSTADYDGATALIQTKDWDGAGEVLRAFRSSYPGNPLQFEATKKIAFIYKEAGKLALTAAEYERIEKESQDVEVRREALLTAADLYVQAKETDKALQVYQRYVSNFPKPLEPALETRNKIAAMLKARNDTAGYLNELKQIVEADAGAGAERTDRTRYLAATASLVLTEPLFDQFLEIKLTKPFDKNLARKSAALKSTKEAFDKLLSYKVGDVTAAATYYIAEMYYSFSWALMESERPDDLNAQELEQYELALDEQSYPFEEKAIQTHEKNLELLTLGIYSPWIDKSFDRLAKMVPARYAKPEEGSGFIETLDTVDYDALTAVKPVLAKPVAAAGQQALDGSAPKRRAMLLQQRQIERAQDGPATQAPSQGTVAAQNSIESGQPARPDFDAAMGLIKAGEYDKGIELLNRVAGKSQNNPVPYINLAMAYRMLGNLKLAEENLKLALIADSASPVANNEYAMVYRKTGRYSEARQRYEKALEKYPQFLLAHKNLGILCDLYTRDYACAQKQYEIYSGAMPEDKTVKIWLADVQKKLKR